MKTILIVDDEPAARYGLRRALEAKYRITEADSAEAAREALPREQIGLCIRGVCKLAFDSFRDASVKSASRLAQQRTV